MGSSNERHLREQLLQSQIRPVVLKPSPAGLVKNTDLWAPIPEFDLIGPGCSPRICMSYKFSSVNDVVTLEDCFGRGEEQTAWTQASFSEGLCPNTLHSKKEAVSLVS